MLWHLANALHSDVTPTWIIAVFDVAFHHGWPTKSLETKFVVFPDRRCMWRAHAEGLWTDVSWLDIKGRLGRCMIMDNPKCGYDDTITALFNALDMIR